MPLRVEQLLLGLGMPAALQLTLEVGAFAAATALVLMSVFPAQAQQTAPEADELLALVRVFLKDPALVILDEASSRLDPLTEQLLERAIDRMIGVALAAGAGRVAG